MERLALHAPPTSLGYSSSGGGGISRSRSARHWPLLPVPEIDDEVFGFTGNAACVLLAAVNYRFGDGTTGTVRGTPANSMPDEIARRHGLGAPGNLGAADLSGHGALMMEHGLRPGPLGAIAVAAAATMETKPSFCLFSGDALGARLLGWCTVVCRLPQWHDVFLRQRSPSSKSFPPKREERSSSVESEEMKVSDVELSEETARDCIMGGDEGRSGNEKVRELSDEVPAMPWGLARLLRVVAQVIRTVKEHTKTLETARDRAGEPRFFAGVAGNGGALAFDIRSRQSSIAVQVLVGSVADAIMDVFAIHMADPALHRQLQRSCSSTSVESRAGSSGAIADVVPLIDGADPAETVGLSVELISDIAWLFSSLEPEGVDNGGSDRGSSPRDGSAAALLSSAMSCWASGRLLACMPGREQLEYALGLSPATNVEGRNVPVQRQSLPRNDMPPLSLFRSRPLPAKLAYFAVGTLLGNLQIAQVKEGERNEATEPVAVPMQTEDEVPTAARACAGRSTAVHRIALLAEQMPAWRERLLRVRQWGPPVQSLGELPDEINDSVSNDDAMISAAGVAATAQVLDVLIALLCTAAEYDRLSTSRREQAEIAGSQRKPTLFNAASIGNLALPTLQAISEMIGPPVSSSGARGGSPNEGVAGSTRSFILPRGKKRYGMAMSGAGAGGESGLRARAGLPITESIDRVHLAGLLLAWEPWHPWMDSLRPETGRTSGARTSSAGQRQSRNWQTFLSLAERLGQACVSPRPPRLPPGKGLAGLLVETVVSFRSTDRAIEDSEAFLDMPAALLLSKVCMYLNIPDGWMYVTVSCIEVLFRSILTT